MHKTIVLQDTEETCFTIHSIRVLHYNFVTLYNTWRDLCNLICNVIKIKGHKSSADISLTTVP
jgi:hypothetical protein